MIPTSTPKLKKAYPPQAYKPFPMLRTTHRKIEAEAIGTSYRNNPKCCKCLQMPAKARQKL